MAPKASQPALPLPPVDVPRQPVYKVWPPRIESLEALDLLMAELSRLEALEQRIAAELKANAAQLTQEAADRLSISLGDEEPMPLADWRSALQAAAEKFCAKNRDALLEEGRKSRDLNHGRFGWRDQPAALEPLPDFPETGNDKILKGLLANLRKALAELADFADGGARFVDVKVTWRKKELLKAYEDQDLPLAILRKTGFAIREEEEKFFITPAAAGVASQSAEKP